MGRLTDAIRHLAWWLDYVTRRPGIPADCVRHVRPLEDARLARAGTSVGSDRGAAAK